MIGLVSTDDEFVGKWVLYSLIYLPLLVPTLALGLEFLPHSEKAWLPDTYLWLSALLVGEWLLTGWLGNMDEDWPPVTAVVVANIVKKSLETYHPSLLARLAFLLLLAAHLFLIWFSFLGGWRLFA